MELDIEFGNMISMLISKLILYFDPYLGICFNHFGLCLATAIHNLKWFKITHICLI